VLEANQNALDKSDSQSLPNMPVTRVGDTGDDEKSQASAKSVGAYMFNPLSLFSSPAAPESEAELPHSDSCPFPDTFDTMRESVAHMMMDPNATTAPSQMIKTAADGSSAKKDNAAAASSGANNRGDDPEDLYDM